MVTLARLFLACALMLAAVLVGIVGFMLERAPDQSALEALGRP